MLGVGGQKVIADFFPLGLSNIDNLTHFGKPLKGEYGGHDVELI